MRLVSLVLALLLVPAVTAAQPGAPPPPPEHAPPPVYAPPPEHAPPLVYAPPPHQVALTAEELVLLQHGEISSGQVIGGVVLNVMFGFGIGQAAQGRFADTGWMFLLGEAGFGSLAAWGFVEAFACLDFGGERCSDGSKGEAALAVGLLGYAAVHIWSIVDAAVGPRSHNKRVRSIRARAGFGMQPYLAPAAAGDSIVGGLSLRF